MLDESTLPENVQSARVAPDLLAAAQKAVQQYIGAMVPADKSIAAIAVADADGLHVGFAGRVGDHWEFDATLERRWADGKVRGQVSVIWSV